MRAAIGLALALAWVAPALAQRGPYLCNEDTSIRLAEAQKPADAKTQSVDIRKFSIVWQGEYLNLIHAGGTDYYECQPVIPRLNEGKPRKTIKCQNGIYFFIFDLLKLRFIKSQLNPQEKTEVGISYGTCKQI